MRRFVAQVTEVRHHRVEYVVEAETLEEALELAANGDTEEEDDTGDFEVSSRVVHEVNEKIEKEVSNGS